MVLNIFIIYNTLKTEKKQASIENPYFLAARNRTHHISYTAASLPLNHYLRSNENKNEMSKERTPTTKR